MRIVRYLIKKDFATPTIALFLVISLLAAALGFSILTDRAQAVALTGLSDTLSNSTFSASSAHTIRYTSTNAVTGGQTIKIQFDPTGNEFNWGAIATSSIIIEGATLQACSGAANEVNVSFDTTAPDENITFIVCANDTVNAGALRIITATSVIANPSPMTSYIIRVGGTQTDSGDTRVAIIDDVVVTAAVDTSLTFTVSSVLAGIVCNGVAATDPSTSTTLAFGNLVVNTPKVICQGLSVATNAANGFVVTVKQDQALRSQTGATIDNFADGASTITPIAWAAASNTLDQPNTYGHIGVTSEDQSLTGGDEFQSALFSGGYATSSREIFMHTGPADGTTPHKGLTLVAYKIQIQALQEAATDYTNTLTYVATPTF